MAQAPRIAEGLARWLKTLETSIAALSAVQTRVAEAEVVLTKNGSQLAALRALSQRLSIAQETVDAALELLWAEESRLSDELGELETRLSSRTTGGEQYTEAERAEAKAGAQAAHVALGQVQQSLAEVSNSVKPAPPRAAQLTQTEEEIREALNQLGVIMNTHLNALLWTQQETEELERSLQAMLHSNRQVLR